MSLRVINEKLWQIEDKIRVCEAKKNFNDNFIELARSVYLTNDLRADIKRELKRLNAKIDRERVRTDSLETQISILLPDLRNTLRATVEAKKQTDSVAILLISDLCLNSSLL